MVKRDITESIANMLIGAIVNMPEYADGVGDCPKCGPAPMKETIVDQDGIPQQVLCLVCKETAAPV